jgi:hypothetical protein
VVAVPDELLAATAIVGEVAVVVKEVLSVGRFCFEPNSF